MADSIYVVNSGLGIITNRLMGSGTEPKYIGWGTGATPATPADTGLQTPGAEARVAGTSSRVQTSTTNDTYQVVGTITCTGSAKAITEVALYDAATSGTCFLHGTFSPINVNVGDSIQFTIKCVFNQG